jgi:hypothetical protein
MNLNHLFEELNLEKHRIRDPELYLITNELTDQDIQQQVSTWLSGLDRHHQVPGKIIGRMQSICDVSFKDIALSRAQRVYAVGYLITYWDQMSATARAQMNL